MHITNIQTNTCVEEHPFRLFQDKNMEGIKEQSVGEKVMQGTASIFNSVGNVFEENVATCW